MNSHISSQTPSFYIIRIKIGFTTILSIKEAFDKNVCFKVGKGDKVFLWLDVWVVDKPQAIWFLDLFNCALDCHATVLASMDKNGHQISCRPTLSGILLENEVIQLMDLL